MGAVLHPVGPLPARVYWVRRIVVLVLVGAVSAVLVSAGAALTGQRKPVARPSVAVTSSTPGPCTPADLTVSMKADAHTYPSSSAPVFAISFTNVSGDGCTFDLGDPALQVSVTSGNDRIWSSADCPSGEAERLLLLSPGAREETSVTWRRVRSAEGCSSGLPEPRPGTYTAVAKVAGASSSGVAFTLD